MSVGLLPTSCGETGTNQTRRRTLPFGLYRSSTGPPALSRRLLSTRSKRRSSRRDPTVAIKPVNPVQNEEQSWESNLAIKQVPGVENEVLEELRRLYAATDPVVIDDRMSGARSLTRANLGRMDDAMKSALLAAIAEGVEQAWVSHDVRPEQTNSTFRNLVLRGYLLARCPLWLGDVRFSLQRYERRGPNQRRRTDCLCRLTQRRCCHFRSVR